MAPRYALCHLVSDAKWVRVHVKKKAYGVGNRYDLDSRWGTGHYAGPSSDVNGGSVVLMDKGTFITTTHMRPGLIDADKEVELEDYQAIVSLPPKRLRGKSTLIHRIMKDYNHYKLKKTAMAIKTMTMIPTTLQKSMQGPSSRSRQFSGTTWSRWLDFCHKMDPSLNDLGKRPKRRWFGPREPTYMEE